MSSEAPSIGLHLSPPKTARPRFSSPLVPVHPRTWQEKSWTIYCISIHIHIHKYMIYNHICIFMYIHNMYIWYIIDNYTITVNYMHNHITTLNHMIETWYKHKHDINMSICFNISSLRIWRARVTSLACRTISSKVGVAVCTSVEE